MGPELNHEGASAKKLTKEQSQAELYNDKE